MSMPDGRTIFCVNGHIALSTVENNVGFGGACPEGTPARPIALVTIEYPKLVTIGFLLTMLGFLLQWFSFPAPSKPDQASVINSN
jgi:hypothetical protein